MASASDRNLIVGVLAFQLDLVSRDDLISAMAAWASQKTSTLEDVFLSKGLIDEETQQLLRALAAKRIDQSADSSKPLSVLSGENLDGIRSGLSNIDDELDNSLASMIKPAYTPSSPPAAEGLETLEPASTDESPMERFRVIRPHAKGGLGEVSVAQDNELHRQVALKRIQPEFADDQHSRQRFLLEAEVTGGLEHPGVVPVYGLGVNADGRPYYAMRLIRGESFKEACKRIHRDSSSTSERYHSIEFRKLLSRFKDVCQTMEYAHSRGVLHRDLKPENIMLGPYGETIVVDWGLAKAENEEVDSALAKEPSLRPSSGSGTSPTRMGSVIGTPAFMSPEQATGNIDKICPQSDVYSLGATLYFLLVGKSPFASRENESASDRDVGKILQRVMAGDFPKPNSVVSSLPASLEAICRKSMALHADARYQSPQALADDVERFLADEPVDAYPDPFSTKVRRWVTRHQTATTTLAAMVIFSTVGLIGFSSILNAKRAELKLKNDELVIARSEAVESANEAQENEERARKNEIEAVENAELAEMARAEAVESAAEAQRQRDNAEERREEAESSRLAAQEAKANELAFSTFMVENILASARPFGQRGGLGIKTSVVQALEASEDQIETVFSERPMAEITTRVGIGDTWQSLGNYQRAIDHYIRASELIQEQLGEDDIEYWKIQSSLANAIGHQGELTQAIALQEKAFAAISRQLGPEASESYIALNNLALSYGDAGEHSKAAGMLKQVVDASTERYGAEDPRTLNAMDNWASQLWFLPDSKQQAVRLYEEIVPIKQRVLGNNHQETLSAINNLAGYYDELGQPEIAISMFQDVTEKMKTQLGDNHPVTLTTLANLGYAYQRSERYDEAIALLESVTKESVESLTEEHPSTINSMDLLAWSYDAAGRAEQAIALYEKVVKLKEDHWGEAHGETLTTKNNLALAYDVAGRNLEAIELFEYVVQRRKAAPETSPLSLHNSMQNLAAAYDTVGNTQRAIEVYEEVVDFPDAVQPRDRWRINHNLAACYGRAGEAARGTMLLGPVLDQMEQVLEVDDWQLDMTRQTLAVLSVQAKEYDRAHQLLVAQVEKIRKVIGEDVEAPQRSSLRSLLFYLAETEIGRGEFERAEEIARESLSLAHELVPGDWRVFNTQSLLGEAVLGQGETSSADELLTDAHDGLVKRVAEIPAGVAIDFISKSFDRMILLAEETSNQADVARWRNEKAEFVGTMR